MPKNRTSTSKKRHAKPSRLSVVSQSSYLLSAKKWLNFVLDWLLPKNVWLRRITCGVIAAVLLVTSGAYGIAYWYQQQHKDEPLALGVTFIPQYAISFGLDPKDTLSAILDDLGVKRLRLVSYWDDIEKNKGNYDFTQLDWQIKMAEQAGADVDLSLGLRQPRWPECHMPDWAKKEVKSDWYHQLKTFMTAVVNRYKDSPALISYQVENEFFMTIFGECEDFDRSRLVEEYNLVKKLDPSKPIVVTRSNNWGGVPVHEPTPDIYGVAVYKRVFDYSATHRYFEYPYPPWFYALLGGMGQMLHGKPLIIHELQMEPWLPNEYQINNLNSLAEQDKSMNADILQKRFKYAEDTGLRTIDTWGVEWWYWRKVKAGDPSLWNVAKTEFAKAAQSNK